MGSSPTGGTTDRLGPTSRPASATDCSLANGAMDEVPVLFVDLDEREEALALATLDPVAALAEADREALAALLEDVHTGDEALLQRIERLAIQTGVIEPDLPEELWDGMPEFHNEPGAVRTRQVHFKTEESVEEFAGLIGQAITDRTK